MSEQPAEVEDTETEETRFDARAEILKLREELLAEKEAARLEKEEAAKVAPAPEPVIKRKPATKATAKKTAPARRASDKQGTGNSGDDQGPVNPRQYGSRRWFNRPTG